MSDVERHAYDVVVIGAGGAGLRAAIEAREQGMRTAVICKSLFGKAHTVMAEGGIAASMGNVNSDDNWQVHFRDTMRGGKFLNHWRMAELHAKEAPDRVWELETWGALFDRTPDGRIRQRNFGGHEYPRLAHVGDRTGLELIRTLQQKIVVAPAGGLRARPATTRPGSRSSGVHGHPGRCKRRRTRSPAPSATGASPAGSFVFDAPAVVLATGGIGKSFKVTSQLLGVHRRRARARAAGRGAADQHGVHPVPPHRHGLAARRSRASWSPSRCAATAACCATARASASCSTTSRTSSGSSTRRPRTRPTAGTPTRTTTAGRPSCCRATRWPARSTPRSRRAAAPRTAGSSWTCRPGCRPRRSPGGCRRCTTSSRSWPTSTSPPSPWRSARPATT